MKNFFFLLTILCSFSSIHSQTWDGDAMDNDWNNPLNWDTDIIPIAGGLVVFNQTVTVISTGAVIPPAQILVSGAGTVLTLDLDILVGDGVTTEHAIRMNANATLVIPDTRTLTINAPATEHGIVNFSGAANAAVTVDAGGSIFITGERGINLQNSSFVFTNNGIVSLVSCAKDGINLVDGATFNNNGSLTILAASQDGIDNSGTFTNTGSINIISVNSSGINNQTTGTFTNNGLIEISDVLNTTNDGVFSSGTFNNQSLGVITIGAMTDDAVDALGGSFTNDGTMNLTVKDGAATGNNGLSVGSNSAIGTFINTGIIEIDGGANTLGTSRAVYVFPGTGGATTLTNNGLITLSNGNPNQLFFTKGTTINGPTGTINTGDGRINVNLWTFTNNGLIVSNFPMLPGVFTGASGTSVNDGFFRTNSSSFSNGAGSITDNGINMNDPAQTTFNLAGACTVTIGGAGAGQLWENILGDTVTVAGPNVSFSNAFPDVASATINASGIDVSLTLIDICAAAILPIELTSFTALRKEKSVMLEWETATEIDNDYMAVERSTNAKLFTEIGRKQGAGDSNSAIRYQLEDTAPLNGINYYRLRQVDFDGTTNYSKIISVNFKDNIGTPTIAIYPNLVKTGEHMEIDLTQFPNQLMTFQLVNSQGQIVNTFSLMGGSRQAFEAGNLPTGMYFLINANTTSKASTKFMVID
jgi:hypothetical protein